MATKFEFVDGFDGWTGMGAYTSAGSDNTMSPWQLRDLSADLAFEPGATDYANMVNPTAGVFGGGALKVPQAQRTDMMCRLDSAETLAWMPIDNYTLGGTLVNPNTPFVVTFGYYFKTANQGYNATRDAVGMELLRITTEAHKETSGLIRPPEVYTQFHYIKRPDKTIWAGWTEPGMGQLDFQQYFTVPTGCAMLINAEKVWFVAANGTIYQAHYPSMGLIAQPGTVASPFNPGAQVQDITLNGEGQFYVLTDDDWVYEYDTSWAYTGNSWDISGDVTGATGICHKLGKAEFLVGGSTADPRLVTTFNDSFVFQSSFTTGRVPAGGAITALAAGVTDVDEYWIAYTRSDGRPDVDIPASARGNFTLGDASTPITGIMDDGFMCWTFGGHVPTGAETVRGQWSFYRGLPLSTTTLFDTEANTITFDWGETKFVEHAYRALSSNPDPATYGVGIATTRVDGVKLPFGVADVTDTADFSSGVQPYIGGGNFYRVILSFRETQHYTSGDCAFLDDFYLISNDQQPSADPEDYLGEIKVHTLRPERVQGDFAPVGTFNPVGWPESVNRSYAANDTTSYLIGQAAGDKSTLTIANPPTITGTIEAVMPVITWCRDDKALGTSAYPDPDHLEYLTASVTPSASPLDYTDYIHTDTETELTTFPHGRFYNLQTSASVDMNDMAIGYHFSEINPVSGVAWTENDVKNMRVHLRVAGGYAYNDWPFVNEII